MLGIHPLRGGVVIRAFRPDATKIDVLPDFGGRIPMEPRAEGLFEVVVPNHPSTFGYLLEVHYPDGNMFTIRDPYCFLPTLGELDLYLLGEGRHERLWERLGAHPIHHYGVNGVSFAVWAPTAEGVSVVGDFNSWDGRLHAMRLLGASGVWELFIPDLGEGTR